ncbi:hypothetical protein AAFC00_006373 [Neodothiora populina]|uniref:WD40 repeat-like protein n=1 Tax=Neodothiora populina TaxID=2781224 RepID=A0ABR3P580_9PEZI
MDIHRSRFVAYPSSPINTLAFSRSNDKNLTEPKPALKLALGRANGDIEIWNADKGNWVQEIIFPASDDRSVDALAWIQEPDETDHEGKAVLGQLRLFSIGSTPAVTEWDLQTGLAARTSTGNFSEVWCFAAQPRWKASKGAADAAREREGEFRGQNIVIGCGDGSLALLSTADDDLVFQRFLARSSNRKARCMSVTWQNRNTIVAGFTDSTIRVFDARSGAMLRNMSLGAGVPGSPRDSLVWRLKCLPDGNIVSADSNGEVRIWDGSTYALSQRLLGHESDCLELITSTDGQTIFSGGMDGRIAVYKLGAREGDKKGRWAKVSHRRMHDGDIKAMAVYDTKQMSIVVSGGLDTTPVVTPLRSFGQQHHRRLPGLPQSSVCASAPSQRLLVTWWDREISIWRINKPDPERISPVPEQPRKLLSRIAIQGEHVISSATISEDGSLLAVATLTSIKAFHLSPTNDPMDDRLRVRKLALPEDFDSMGARLVAFSPDSRWLAVVAADSEVHIARLDEAGRSGHLAFLPPSVELDRITRRNTKQSGLHKYEKTITKLAFSPDSALLVAGDLSGYLDSWVLHGHFDETAPSTDTAKVLASGSPEDDPSSDSDSDSDSDDEDENTIFYAQHWAENPSGNLLPKLDSAALILSFRPSTTKVSQSVNGNPGVHATRNNPHAHSTALPNTKSPLFVVTAQHQVYEFDVLAGKLTDWSRRNPTTVLPAEFHSIKDRVMGLVWDVNQTRARTWLYGSNWVGMLDLSQNYEQQQVGGEDALEDGIVESEYQTPGKKRKRRESQVGGSKRNKLLEQRRRSNGAVGSLGAGGRIADAERLGTSGEVKRIEDGKVVVVVDGPRDVARMIEDGRQDNDDEDDDDDDDGDDDDAMVDDMDVGPLRRANDDNTEVDGGSKDRRRKWWCTYRYRPILGMVPIGQQQQQQQQDDDDDDTATPSTNTADDSLQEAVLVERPLWDLPHLKDLIQSKA